MSTKLNEGGPEAAAYPKRIEDVAALEELMTRPSQALTADLSAVDGDIMVLGAGGKMGPTLCPSCHAARHRTSALIAVARFSAIRR